MAWDIKAIVTQFGVIGAALVFFFYIFQKIIDRRIESAMKSSEAAFKVRLDFEKQYFDRRMEAINFLQKQMSASRNAVRLVVMSPDADSVYQLKQHSRLMADALYGIQLLLKADTYDTAHLFKRSIEAAWIHAEKSISIDPPQSPPVPNELLLQIDSQYAIASKLASAELDQLVVSIKDVLK
jgi:hypothetical protein